MQEPMNTSSIPAVPICRQDAKLIASTAQRVHKGKDASQIY